MIHSPMHVLTYSCTHAHSCIYTCEPSKIHVCGTTPCEKSWKQGNPLSNTMKDTSTTIRNPSLHNSGKGLRLIVLVYFIVLLWGISLFILHMVHPIPASPFIQLAMNDFALVLYVFIGKRSCLSKKIFNMYNYGNS